jgi:hypothetical protein
MRHPERIYFEKLKEEIGARYRQYHPDAGEKIEEWSGKTIEGFQEDLQQEVKSAISLRWFYMHIKSVNEDKIPRTDVLDLLSSYAGYNSWADFINKKKAEGIVSEEIDTVDEKKESVHQPVSEKTGNKRYVPMIVAGLILITVTIVWAMNRKTEITCKFCFSDADIGKQIMGKKIGVTIMRDKESPQTIQSNDSGCVVISTKPGKITFVVHAEYYQPDTVTRDIAEGEQAETIMLKPDDYAMMISLFSNSSVEDWERRKNQLRDMFTDDARIFQVYPGNDRGMEMYNKDEFIDKLTTPIASLKNIEVIQTIYKDGKISALRFIQKENKD